MASPIKWPGANDVLGGGHPEILDSPIARGIDQVQGLGMIPTVVSCWELTGAELSEVLRTGKVFLKSWGETHPPICVIGIDPCPPVEQSYPPPKE